MKNRQSYISESNSIALIFKSPCWRHHQAAGAHTRFAKSGRPLPTLARGPGAWWANHRVPIQADYQLIPDQVSVIESLAAGDTQSREQMLCVRAIANCYPLPGMLRPDPGVVGVLAMKHRHFTQCTKISDCQISVLLFQL